MIHIILYIAISHDGFIADKHGSVDFLHKPEYANFDLGFDDFVDSIDVIVQGSRTFVQSLSFIEQGLVPDLPYKGRHMYVFTREPMTTHRTDVTFVSSIQEFLDIMKANPAICRVWLLGGAELIASFAEHDLIDEAIITVMPTDLHEGIALPKSVYTHLHETSSTQHPLDIVEKRYVRVTA